MKSKRVVEIFFEKCLFYIMGVNTSWCKQNCTDLKYKSSMTQEMFNIFGKNFN